jgi:hypothetical protein
MDRDTRAQDLAIESFASKMVQEMKKFCMYCTSELVNRHYLAKVCFPCGVDNPKKIGAVAAINAVQKAVREGILAPVKTLVCVDCGRPGQCYDHRDYNKPLDVVAVCRKCNYRRGKAIPVLAFA